MPPTWFVEDEDFGLIRLVPAANVQMLPLFAMQLAFMGFAESIPGGLWFQYTAGLNNSEYNGLLVLCASVEIRHCRTNRTYQ